MTYPGNGPRVYFHDLWPSSMFQDLCQSISTAHDRSAPAGSQHMHLFRCPLHYPLHDIVSTCIRNVMPKQNDIGRSMPCARLVLRARTCTPLAEALVRPCSTAAGLARSTLHCGEKPGPGSAHQIACSPCRPCNCLLKRPNDQRFTRSLLHTCLS
jgi:hypothetical protein